MKERVKGRIVVLTFLVVILTMSIVNAESSVSMNLTSESKLVEEDIVQVVLSISNIDAGEGIDAIVGKIDYDENIFEELTEEDIETLNRWNLQAYNPDTDLFTLSKSSKVNTNSDIFKINFKVKSGIMVDSTQIKITNLEVSGGAVVDGGTGDIEVQEVIILVGSNRIYRYRKK